MNVKVRWILPAAGLLLFLAAAGMGIWHWYDNNVDRSGWVEKDGQRIYRDFYADPVSGWLELPEGTYYFPSDGIPCTGWQKLNGFTYYFGADGVMTTGWLEQNGKRYYFGDNGAMVPGWLWLGEDRYYFRDGYAVTGWQEIEGQTYYFDDEGIMSAGFTDIEGNRYHFSEDGILTIGFADIDGSRYYFGEDGVLVTGLAEIEGQTYQFGTDGAMFTGWEITDSGRRYFLADGPMALGWQSVEGQTCYFGEDGFLVSGWVNRGEYRCYLYPEGGCAIGPTQIDGETHYFSPGGLEVILVNALNPVPDYFERDLVNVVDYHDVDRRCYDALVQMLDDCTAAGIEYDFNSAYRTVEEQAQILAQRTQEYMDYYEWEEEKAREKALETVALPGTSEHNLGLAVDLLGSQAVSWFQEHCWDYGFIVRYAADKQDYTGITNEPWHFRYVGKEDLLLLYHWRFFFSTHKYNFFRLTRIAGGSLSTKTKAAESSDSAANLLVFLLRCCNFLPGPLVNFLFQFPQIGRKPHIFRPIGQLEAVFQGKPGINVRFIVLDHRLQPVQRLVKLCLSGFLGVHLFQKTFPLSPDVRREGLNPAVKQIIFPPGIGIGFDKSGDVPGKSLPQVMDQAHPDHPVQIQLGKLPGKKHGHQCQPPGMLRHAFGSSCGGDAVTGIAFEFLRHPENLQKLRRLHRLSPFQKVCGPEIRPAWCFQDRTILSSTSSEPEAWLNRLSRCSTVRFFFSSPDTSTTTWPSYIIISRLP